MNLDTISSLIAILVGMAALLKYVFYSLDKHQKSVDGRFKEHKEKLHEHANAIRDNEREIRDTRDELHTQYVRHEHLDKKLDDHGAVLKQMFDRINAMARDLNQLIGAHNGKVKRNDDE